MSDDESRGDAAHVEHQNETAAIEFGINHLFEHDPIGAARRALIRSAECVATRGATSEVQKVARRVAISEMLMDQNRDPDVMAEAQDRQLGALRLLAEYPAETIGDLTYKLAALHHVMAGQADDPCMLPRIELALVGSILADAVLLQAGPLTLPAECKGRIATAEDVERWRQRAIEMDTRR